MATRVTLTPNGTAPRFDDSWVVTGTTSKVTAVNDASDSTFLRKPATNNTAFIGWNLTTSTLGSAVPWRVRVACRVSTSAGSSVTAGWGSVSSQNGQVNVGGPLSQGTVLTVTNRARTSDVVTLTTSAAHGLAVGDVVSVNGVATGFNGSFDVTGIPTSTTFTYVSVGTNVASTASTGTVERMNMIGEWYPFRYVVSTGVTDQAAVDDIYCYVTDYSSSATRGTVYKAYLDLETTTTPTTAVISHQGIGQSVAVTAATQSGTSVTVTVASHSFLVNDTVYLTGVTGLTLGTNQGVVTATTATSVTFTVSGSATATGTVSSAVLMPRVTTTAMPTLGWSYTQADSIPQYGYQVAVHSAATATPGTGGTLVWGTAATRGSTTTPVTVGTPLSNATTYWVYARTYMRALTDGFADVSVNTDYYGAWSSASQMRLDIAPPTTPTVTATWQSGSQSVSVTATGASYALGTQTFSIQRSDDGGATWTAVRNATETTTTATTLVVTDYEVPRGISAQYRAAAIGTPTGLTTTVSSPWSTAASATTTSDGTHWLKDPVTPANNLGGVAIIADPSFTVEERVEVLRPLGRADAVVVAGAIGEEDGSFEVHAASDATWTSLKRLLYAQRTLLWQDAFDTQRYIRITSRAFTRLGARGSARYSAQVQYVEVAAP